MQQKCESLSLFLQFKSHVENYFQKQIKIFRYDGVGEFTSHSFQITIKQNDIIHQLNSPYTPE